MNMRAGPRAVVGVKLSDASRLGASGRRTAVTHYPSPPDPPPLRGHPYARKPASKVVLISKSGMQLTLDATRRIPHGASRLAMAMSAWSVKTRRAPLRRCRDAPGHRTVGVQGGVYGHTTTAMHDNEYTSPSLPLHHHRLALPLQLPLYSQGWSWRGRRTCSSCSRTRLILWS